MKKGNTKAIIEERNKQIVDRYCNGFLNCPEIAGEFGLSPEQVLWILKKKGVEIKWRRRRSIKYEFDRSFFQKIDSAAKAYWLGFLMADGGVILNNTLVLRLAKKDECVLEDLLAAIKANTQIKNYVSLGKPGIEIRLYSKRLIDDLKMAGLVGVKSKRRFPGNLPRGYEPDFIRGLLDGDGCVSVRTPNPGVKPQPDIEVGGNRDLIERVGDILVEKCGVRQKSPEVAKKDWWILRYSGALQVKRIYDFLYYQQGLTCLKRKKEILDEYYKEWG